MKRTPLVLLLMAACAAPPDPAEEARRCYLTASRTEDPEEALALLDRAIQLRPAPEYHERRAGLYARLGRLEPAIADFGAAIELSKPSAWLYNGRGILLSRARRLREAEADFTEAIRLDPTDVDSLLRRAELRKNDPGDLAKAAKIGKDAADGYHNEGVRALNANDPVEAERMFRFALWLDPDHVWAHVALARMHLERRRFAEAAAELDKAIPGRPGDGELYYHRGNARLAAGRGDDALADFEMAVSLSPKEPLFLAARGLAWHQVRKDTAKARVDYDEALKGDPNCYAAWYNLGLLLHDLGDLPGAEHALRKAASIRASPEGCLALGRVLHDRGEYDKALMLYKGAMDLYKDSELQKALREASEKSKQAKENRK